MKRVGVFLSRGSTQLVVLAVAVALTAFGLGVAISHPEVKKVAASAICPQNTTCITLKDDRAEPDVITVPLGGYAQFNSADGQTHNIGEGSGDEHHDGSHVHTGTSMSGDFKSDEAWRVQFKQTGTYDFHDHYHPEIHATVIVYQPGGDYKIK